MEWEVAGRTPTSRFALISDEEMLRILRERANAGVEIRVIGRVAGRPPFGVHRLAGMRLHTRTIIRDRQQAFVGSQSLRRTGSTGN